MIAAEGEQSASLALKEAAEVCPFDIKNQYVKKNTFITKKLFL